MQTMERSTRSSRRDAAAAAVRVPSTSSSVPAGPPGSQSDGGQFLCIECSETFATKLQLNAHLQSHTATKPYVCSHCGRGFHHQVFLQMHERSHEHGSLHNQTSAAKPSPSRVISTRSSKVVVPVEEDKVHVKDPQSKHGPSPNITVEFRKEKPTPQVVAPIECVTRLTRGKAPTLYHQDEEPEKRSAFGFHVSKYSNNTVHLMDAFGNSIELLTEVFNLYASTEPEGGNAAENTVPSDHAVELSSTVLQHPCQSNTASPVNEEACRNGSLESSVSAVRNGVSPESDVSPAEEGLDDLKVDDATPSATVAPENVTQVKCKSPGGTRSASSDLPAENTSLAVPETSDDDVVLAEQMETDSKGFTGKRDTTTSMLADSVASSSAPAGRTGATSNSEEHAAILSSDLLPAAAVETSTQQSGGVENLLSGDRDIVSSKSVSTSQENACNAAHKDNGFLDNVAELTSSAESKVVSPTDEPDQPKLQPEAGKDHQCHTRPSGESHVLNEGQQEIQAETSAQSEHTDITCSVSPPINLHQYSALTTSADEETERSGDDEAGRSPAGDLTKEMNLTESERSPVCLPQSEFEPSQQVCSDPDALQECVLSETAEGDRATKELGEGAADDAEIPDRSGLSDCKAAELVDKELNLFPSESLAEAQYSTKTFSQPQSEEGDIEGHREEEGSISDHMSPATPEDDLSNQVTLDTCTSQEDTMLSETGNSHLPISVTDAEPSPLLQQVKVQGTTELDSDEKGEQTENPTFAPDQTKVRDISQAETVTGSDASSQEMTELGTGTILSNEDRVEFTEQNHEPALVTEEQNLEPALVTEEQNLEPALVTEEQNLEPALVTEEQNLEPALVTEEQNLEPALVTEEQNHEPALVTEEQNHEPALVTEEQNHEPALVTEEQNLEPALVTEEQNHEPALVTEEQNLEPALVTEEQNHEPALVTEEQNHEPALVTEQTITVSATNTAECADKSPRATSNSAILLPEEDGLIDSATPSAQGLHPEGSPSCEMEICHVENIDSLLPPDILGPQSSDHPPREEPEHLVPTDTAEQVPLNVDIAEKESDDQLRDLKGKDLLSDSAEPSKPTQNHNEGEPEAKEQPSASILTTCETESSAASSLSNDCNQDVIDKTTAPSNPAPSAEPNTEGPLCLAPSSNTPSVPDTGTSVGAGEVLTELPAGQTSSQEEKLETSKEPLLSPKSKLRQAISEMSVYCMSGKLLTVGAKCLLCDQKLRTYRGEISSPICRKCRLNKKNRDPCFMTELPPHSQSSLERDLLTKASPCRIKREAAESEDSLKPLESSDTEAETAEKMYKCHKCDKSFALSVLLAGHVKFHSLPKCLTCGRLMRLRFKARRIPRNCRVCTKKLKDKRKEEGNESSDENKSDESLTVSQASLKDKDNPEQFPHGDNKYRPRSQKVVKTKLSTRKFHHTRRVGKKAAGSVSASKRGVGAPLKSTYDLSKSASIKPYKCTKCPMSFKRPIYLVKHMRKHMPSALHNPFTALKGSPHHSDSDLDPKNLTYSDVLGVRPGEKKVLRRKRQKQGSDEPAMERKRRPVQKPRLSKPILAFVDSETLSSDGYSVGNPCQVLNQGEGGRVMTPFGGFSAKEEANETPISDHNPCKEDALSDSGTSSPDESTSGDKPHMCQHCGKRFQHYRSLHLHVLVHTAIQCESCGRRLRFKKRAGRRSKKCRLCRLQEKEQVFEPPLPAATKKPLTLGKARASTVLPPNKRTRIMKNLKGQSLAELKQMSKGMKQLLVKGLARKPRKQKPGSELLKVAGRKKKVKDLPELSQVDPLGIDHPESSPSTSAIKLEDGTFSDSAGKVMFVSTMKMKKAKGLVNEHEAACEETQEPLHDQPASDKPPQCSVCDQEFENQELLFAHMQSHADVLLFPCPHCPYRFHKKPLLKIHLFTHFKDRPHRCTDCNKSFTRINHLNMHRRVHMGIRPYSCPDCPSSFRHKVSMLVHRYSHSKVLPIDLKPYQCAYCAKRFLRSDHLEVHQRFHTGECPFQCPDCDKTFPSKARLSIHSRVHSGVRPHSCPTCQRSFIHKANLERHLQKHTGELAFSCVKCSVRFPSLVTLAQHKHTHRREEVFSCVHCAKRFLYKKSLYKHQNLCQGGKKVKLGDGQVGGIKRRRRLKEDNPEPGVKRPRLKKNPTGTKLDKEGNPIKAKRIKKEKDTEEEQGQEKPSESLDLEESAPKKGKRKQPEAKGAKVKRIKKEKATSAEEQGQEKPSENLDMEESAPKKGKRKQPEGKGAKVKRVKKEKAASAEEQGPETAESTEESAPEKGKKKIPKNIKVRKIRKKATSEEDASTESGINKVRRKQTEGNPQKAEGKPEKGTGNVRGKREKVQKEGVKLKPQKEESTKSKKSSEGRKQQGEDKPKNSRLGVKRGPYKKRLKTGAPGEKKTRIVRVKVKSVQVKLKPGRKKKQVMKEKKEKV